MTDVATPSIDPTATMPIAPGGSIKSFAPKARTHEEMREAAQEFEAVFISQMMNHMFDGIETNDTFGGGQAEDIYRSMMIDEYGKIMAKTGGIGVADQMMRQMVTMQEAEQYNTPQPMRSGYVSAPPQTTTSTQQ